MAVQQLIVLVLMLVGMAAAGPKIPTGIIYPSAPSGTTTLMRSTGPRRTATLKTTCELVKLDDTLHAELSCTPLPPGVRAGGMKTIDPVKVSFKRPAATGRQAAGRKLQQAAPTPPGTPCPVGYIYVPPGLNIYLAGLSLNITTAINIELSGYTQGGILGTLVCALASSPQAPASQTASTVNQVLATPTSPTDPTGTVTVTNATMTDPPASSNVTAANATAANGTATSPPPSTSLTATDAPAANATQP